MTVSPTNGKRVSIASLKVRLEYNILVRSYWRGEGRRYKPILVYNEVHYPRMIILGDVHANDDDSQSNITSAEAKDDRSQGSQEHLSAPNPVEVLFACRSVRPGKRRGSEGSGEEVTQ
jgi:hypothetical protein